MKISAIRCRPVSVPMNPPIVSRSGRFDAMTYVLVDVATDEGLTGISYLWSFSSNGSRGLLAALAELNSVAMGADPADTDALWAAMWKKMAQWGHYGLSIIAMSAIDTACWDIKARAAGVPVSKLLNAGSRDSVDTYYSGGLWLVDDLDALRDEAARARKQGFLAAKMRIGRDSLDEDLEAIEAVRQGLGDGAGLMADANSGWTLSRARSAFTGLDPQQLAWIEDPLAQDDFAGHAALAEEFDTPVMFGEKAYGLLEFERIVALAAADHLMPDLQRVGGVSGWQAVQQLAAGHGLPVSSHLFPEFNVQLVASASNGRYVECMDWCAALFNERLDVEAGRISVPQRPGFGFSWNEDSVERFRDAGV